MGDSIYTTESRRDLEARVLAAALKQSFERGDMSGALLAHRQLTELLKQQLEQPHAGADAPRQIPAQAPSVEATAQAGSTSTQGQTVSGAVIEEIAPEAAQPVASGGAAEIGGAALPGTLAGSKSPETPRFDSYYHILGLEPVSPFKKIRVRFLSQVKNLLRERATNKDLSDREFRDRLRTLCVAYDVLRDPNTRTDYDFRLMGLRGGGEAQAVETPTDSGESHMPNKPHLRIGELLQCSEILEPTELEIAVDMHRAMPELPFGQFLVKQGFLTDSELYSALLGQRLIIDGKITVAQFQTAMYMLRESSIPLSETLVSRGWVSRQELESVTIPDPLAGAFAGPRLTRQVQEVPVSARPKDAGKINASNAVPSWAGQIDWADSAQSEAPPAPEIVPSEPEPAPEQAKLAQPEQAATPTPDKQAPPPPMRQAADVGRDPIVRALQEQLAAIHLGETPRKEEASPESWPKVEALEPEPGSPEGKENDSSRPAGPPAELEPHLEQIEEEPGGPATS